MKILITGVNGLVGNSLYKLLEESDHIVYSSSRNIEGLAKYKVDITANILKKNMIIIDLKYVMLIYFFSYPKLS